MVADLLFTSESVSEGHPDKICDRISDEIVDLVYREAIASKMDANSVRVACEVLVTKNKVIVAGEVRLPVSLLKTDPITSQYVVDKEKFEKFVRSVIRSIGYEQEGFHWETVDIEILLHSQSIDIARGVDNSSDDCNNPGAGDQGIMFGYACRETADFMPAPIYYAHRILRFLADARKSGTGDVSKLGPDAKSQVTIRYVDNKVFEVKSIVLSTQHFDPTWDREKVHSVVEPYIRMALEGVKISSDCSWYINPAGKFVIGGPFGDAGLTGRKVVVDTYGGAAPHGGGAFSGKDVTKVDRAATYAARYLAKNIVAADLADRCTIQLSYAIGVSRPLSIFVDLHNSGKVSEVCIARAINKVMDLSVSGIRNHLNLSRPIYAKTSAYGHFGRSADQDGFFPWEALNLVDSLRKCVGF
ncbi:S-adenosylmethionine synthetase [Candidatus Liberibacter solanacearum]|uniref:Methionine adenosyltransferase n=1 Tax=Candidatus Liberibacter solanacearum TaxID=556287 RepID=A0A095BF76_9HYPH|nr:methionine adenosyltransferase [Candidatus Liberibacter solanacearum]KGB27473.1 S-adenosylmethionine synthetase [Candidatus Liberibacter solanacearum]KJZ81067.1 S-adenosylmethionine synthetase [Candidatus Liberibacter solanacearum]KJZ82256.1 S-adenosylmethionine synthetase [Candidatus Liberibacter solanacearum]KQC49331.1 S-adenosylmethionine synthetase [Candidatus Liberibacter solanacearum]